MHQPLDHLRSRKKPVSKPVWIALDSDVADRYSVAKARHEQAEKLADANPANAVFAEGLSDMITELEEAEALWKENSAKFVARSLGPNDYEELVAKYPPTDEQRREAKKMGVRGSLSFNTDSFPRALIVACVSYVEGQDEDGHDILVEMSAEYVDELYSDPHWNAAELNALFEAAFEVNSTRRVVEMGNASRRTRSS